MPKAVVYKWLVVHNTSEFKEDWPSHSRRKKRDNPCRIFDTADAAYRSIVPALRSALKDEKRYALGRTAYRRRVKTVKEICDRIEQLIQREQVMKALALYNRNFLIRSYLVPQVRRIPYEAK